MFHSPSETRSGDRADIRIVRQETFAMEGGILLKFMLKFSKGSRRGAFFGKASMDQGGDEAAKRQKERANRRFAREEMGELLRLFSALGVTVAAGIVGFFWLGLWVDGKLNDLGWRTYGVPRIAGVLFGVVVSIYWAYLRIAKHLDKFAPRDGGPEDSD
jgi:hypothetical protein